MFYLDVVWEAYHCRLHDCIMTSKSTLKLGCAYAMTRNLHRMEAA